MLHSSPSKRIWAIAASLTLWILLVTLDLALGLKVRFGPFYAIPVMLMAWYLGRGWGIASAFVTAILWHAIEMIALHNFTITFYRYWDLASGLLAFSSIAVATSWSKDMFDRQETLNRDLKKALDQVQVLEGLLPICAWCRKVRDDKGLWEQIETYVSKHSGTIWTHGICPECAEKLKIEGPI